MDNKTEKITLDWKAISERKVTDYVGKLDDDSKKSFAKACSETVDGKNVINKSKAKKWLVKYRDDKDDIEWKNRPKNIKTISAADEVASWLEL